MNKIVSRVRGYSLPVTIQRHSSSNSDAAAAYKSLPEESKKLLDRMIRVDHAGTPKKYFRTLILL